MGKMGWSLRPRGYPVTRFPFTVLPVTTGLSWGPRDASVRHKQLGREGQIYPQL
jgi:hypothetical protein